MGLVTEVREKGGREVRGHPIFAALYDTLTRRAEKKFIGSHRVYLCGGVVGRVLDVGCETGRTFPTTPPRRTWWGLSPTLTC